MSGAPYDRVLRTSRNEPRGTRCLHEVWIIEQPQAPHRRCRTNASDRSVQGSDRIGAEHGPLLGDQAGGMLGSPGTKGCGVAVVSKAQMNDVQPAREFIAVLICPTCQVLPFGRHRMKRRRYSIEKSGISDLVQGFPDRERPNFTPS